MKNDKYSEDIKTLRDRNSRKNIMIGALTLAILLQLVVLTQVAGTSRTVIVPPHVDRTFWVTDEKASASYLEQMAGYTAWLVLDVTPGSIDWHKRALLEFVSADAASDFKTRMELEADRLRKLNATTYFALTQLAVNEANQSVTVSGQLHTQINGVLTSVTQKKYVVTFEFKGGRMHLKDFKEAVNETKK